MTLHSASRLLLTACVVLLSACESPSAPPQYPLADLRRASSAELCDPLVNPICTAFETIAYAYDPAVAPLPPGISDWVLKITQNGGTLEFLGAVTHGGTAITSVANMYVRFFIDNGDGVLGAGDLQVVLRSNSGSAEIHCGIVTTLPTGSVLAPTSSPTLCENTGYSTNDNGRFFFDGYRTVDLSEPLWVAQGFQPLTANSARSIWLFQVGNVDLSLATPMLLAATAPVNPVPYALPTIAGPPVVPDDNGDGDDDDDPEPIGDVTAPTIVFSGNVGTYTVDQHVDIDCVASDAGSGIASASCPSAEGPAYTFGVGQVTLQASATDSAGNTATAQTSFEVTATSDGLCALGRRFAQNIGIGTALCAQIAAAAKKGEQDGTVAARVADAVEQYVTTQRGKGFGVTHANLLLQLVGRL